VCDVFVFLSLRWTSHGLYMFVHCFDTSTSACSLAFVHFFLLFEKLCCFFLPLLVLILSDSRQIVGPIEIYFLDYFLVYSF
jgi:hypothetical protein